MQRSKAPATTSRRGGLALMRRLIVSRQATACQVIRTLEPAKPRIRHSPERRTLGLQLCARHVPKYYVSADTLEIRMVLFHRPSVRPAHSSHNLNCHLTAEKQN